ncbi:MAG TPA: nucleotide disphospho-sugar-binding domain-containing protein [Acidimicrobiales bacterium]|nr:nucleotide disphospho-sugar-binding domain-containing protein [Acidimicrobiales bacterium]
MARFLFVTWWGGGNVLPAVAIGHELVARGHEVAVLGDERVRAQADTAGLGFVATTDPARDTAELAGGVDVAVVDFMMPEVLSVLEAVPGVRTAALVHTLFAKAHDRMFDLVLAFTSLDRMNDQRLALGLDRIGHGMELLDERRVARVLLAFPAVVDSASVTPLPPHARFLGAIDEPLPTGASWVPPVVDDRPLVVVSLGTTPMDEAPVLQRVLDVAADLDVRVVATVGLHLDPAALSVPPNASVSGYVPHALVLPQASVLVTHAGLGTTVAGLRAGVPLLCLPLGRDQPGNAARVAELGAGRVLPPDAPAAELALALRGLLASGAPERVAARSVAAEIASASPPGAAADAVEELAAER